MNSVGTVTLIDNQSVPRFPALDGLRGIAFLVIFFHHYGDLSNSSNHWLSLVGRVKDSGWLGVDLFFALSGFLITGVLSNTRNDPHRFKNFYARRVLRLWPLFYGVWLFLAAYCSLYRLPWQPAYWAYILHLGNFVSYTSISVGPFFISHFWSLAIEEQFYLFWPVLLWKVKPVTAIRVLAALVLLSIGMKAAVAFSGSGIQVFRFLGAHAEPICFGALAALAIRVWYPADVDKVANAVLPVSCLALAAMAVAYDGLSQRSAAQLCFSLPLLGLASASLIIKALKSDSIVSRAFNFKLLRFYGRYSYGLYVFHLLLRGVFRAALYPWIAIRSSNNFLTGVTYITLCLVLLTAMSVLSYHFFKRHFSGSNVTSILNPRPPPYLQLLPRQPTNQPESLPPRCNTWSRGMGQRYPIRICPQRPPSRALLR